MPQNETELKTAIRCILLALDGLHRNGIVHRDVRWPNIVLDTPNWTLIDLDTAAFDQAPPNWKPSSSSSFPPEYSESSEPQAWIPAFDVYQVGRLLLDPRLFQGSMEENRKRGEFAEQLCNNHRLSAREALALDWLSARPIQ